LDSKIVPTILSYGFSRSYLLENIFKSIQVLEEEYRKNLKKLGEKNGKKN